MSKFYYSKHIPRSYSFAKTFTSRVVVKPSSHNEKVNNLIPSQNSFHDHKEAIKTQFANLWPLLRSSL